jgi:hypothetical protein
VRYRFSGTQGEFVRTIQRLALLSSGVSLFSTPGWAEDASADEAAGNPIIVTARQRPENAQDVPAALGMPVPSPTWWVNFRVIEEGSWGSRGGVLSILDLLETGAFTAAKSAAIRTARQQGADQ